MSLYTYRVTLVSKTATKHSTQKHDYVFLSSAHHACVQHVSPKRPLPYTPGGRAGYRHAKIDNGVAYITDDGTRTATIVWQPS